MYFKISIRKNPQSQILCGYYQLVESYRTSDDRIRHRLILNAGFLDELNTDELNLIQKILTSKVKNYDNPLFEHPYTDDSKILSYVDLFFNQMIAEKKIDVLIEKKEFKSRVKGKDIEKIDLNSIRNKDIKELGAEWLSYQAMNQLNFRDFFIKQGWNEEDIQLAQSHIISRAVFPASELETSRWMRDNSSVCELTGYNLDKLTKDKLYNISKKLYKVKDQLEEYLSTKTNELFDIEDKIMLYDLTNTYFEGRKTTSSLAKYGRSKEKRGDAKLVVLALVVNPEGFIKYSSILQGNIADPKTLSDMITGLRVKTSLSTKKALVVIDAGIATEENLSLIRKKGFDYICVSRSNLTKYSIDANSVSVSIRDNKNQKIELCPVQSNKNTDYYLKVESFAKEQKERSMNEQFLKRFEDELTKISLSLTKKGGVKIVDKVHERIGRVKQKYPSIQRYFDIKVEIENLPTKENESEIKKRNVVTSIKWEKKNDAYINAESGIYFLRTSLKGNSETDLWTFYNTIREIEATFRILKTDLDLRPIYHKNDDSTMAHLHLGLLAYWVVNTIRYQLKKDGIKSSWREIVRIMNTQKIVTTTAENHVEDTICIRRCSEPTQQVTKIYDSLKYKYAPFVRKKSVVHKTDFKNCSNLDNRTFPDP